MTRRRAPAFLVVAAFATAWHPGSTWAADPLTDGRKALAGGQWDKAEERLRKAGGGPTDAEARLLLADLLLLRGRAVEAAALGREAMLRPATAAAGATILARAELRLGHPEAAIRALRPPLKADPAAHTIKVLLARALIETGDEKSARSLLEPMVQADDRGAYRTAAELTALGGAARLLGRIRFAFQALDDAATQDPADPAPLLELGRAALDAHDTLNAEKAFARALELRPEHPGALVGLARVELEIARTYDDALALLDRAQAVDPAMPEAERMRAEADIHGEHPGAALARLGKLLATNPRDVLALSLVAAAHDSLGDSKAFEGTIRWIVLVTVWSGAALGLVLNFFWLHAPKWVSVLAYIAVGWVGVLTIPQMFSQVGVTGSVLVLVGGALYTLGAITYAVHWPNPFPRTFGFHEIFHVLVVIAATAQFVAVSLVVT